MSVSKVIWAGGAAALMSLAILLPTNKVSGADETPTPHHGHGRLTKPWTQLKDLTDTEKTKVLAIHQKALDEIHALEAKEHADILDVLTDDQKKEVAAIEAKDKAAARAHKPTTRPSK